MAVDMVMWGGGGAWIWGYGGGYGHSGGAYSGGEYGQRRWLWQMWWWILHRDLTQSKIKSRPNTETCSDNKSNWNMFQYSVSILFYSVQGESSDLYEENAVITACIRRMGEGTVFTGVCLSTPKGGGGYPGQGRYSPARVTFCTQEDICQVVLLEM